MGGFGPPVQSPAGVSAEQQCPAALLHGSPGGILGHLPARRQLPRVPEVRAAAGACVLPCASRRRPGQPITSLLSCTYYLADSRQGRLPPALSSLQVSQLSQ